MKLFACVRARACSSLDPQGGDLRPAISIFIVLSFFFYRLILILIVMQNKKAD